MDQLVPVHGKMSSQYSDRFVVENCLDNDPVTHCATDPKEKAPWIAFEFEGLVDVRIVKVIAKSNPVENLSMLMTDELPADGSEMFNKGSLLGTFRGPSWEDEPIFITGEARGRFLLLQMDNKYMLRLDEIKVYGPTRGTGKNKSKIRTIYAH